MIGRELVGISEKSEALFVVYGLGKEGKMSEMHVYCMDVTLEDYRIRQFDSMIPKDIWVEMSHDI